MTFGSPWALLGLATLVVPVVIHLLGRHRARVQKFPSLRFLTPSRLMPTRRTRLNDVLILIVRLGIVAAAVIALAHPIFESANRTAAMASALSQRTARAI